jgi:hypothetical protein
VNSRTADSGHHLQFEGCICSLKSHPGKALLS